MKLRQGDTKAFLIALASLGLLFWGFQSAAQAQAPAGIATDSLVRWPPYVYDTEMPNRGRVVMSVVGGRSYTGGDLGDASLYSGLEIGLTDRLLLAIAGSTATSTAAATKLDEAAVEARYRFASEARRRPALALGGSLKRVTFLEGTGVSPYEAQISLIAQKSAIGCSFYGQAGYTTRNQPFEGFGISRPLGERLVVSGNYSYRHGRLFSKSVPLPAGTPTSAVVYATGYFALSDRVGLTAAVGRSFPSHSDSGGFTRFVTVGMGFALKQGFKSSF